MSAHTPGEWKIAELPEDGGGLRIFALSDAQIAPATVFGDTPEQRLANARLIAAAPDLLKALEAMTARYTALVNCGDCGNWNPETEAEVIAARAALAKAKGTK